MEKVRSNDMAAGQNQDDQENTRLENPDTNTRSNEDEDVKHHQHFGNRKYESHTNHSSHDDQPMTDTSPTGTSPNIT